MADLTQTPESAVSAERQHAYKMAGPGREPLVDALAKQLHHNESLHLHTLPGDEGDACKYCYLRAGRSVGALAPVVEPALITTAEQLRALPVDTIIMSLAGVAFQVEALGKQGFIIPARLAGAPYMRKHDGNMADLLKHAPFRVLHTPEVTR